MCGLFGWQLKDKQGGVSFPIRRALTEAADTRGGQAWGFWGGGKAEARGIGPASGGVGAMANISSVIGHSRWATHGGNTIENTHPFVRRGLAVAHNGVVSNHQKMNAQFGRLHVVDSQHFVDHLADDLPFSDFESYGALSWAALAEPDIVHLARLSESGNLAIAQTKLGVFWQSDEHLLLAALRDNGVEVEFLYEVNAGSSYYAKKGTLFRDTSAPSRLVSSRAPMQDWASFMTGVSDTELTQSQLWAAANPIGEVSDDERDGLKMDLAKWWLEDTMGYPPAIFEGMSDSELHSLATDMGFDSEAEVRAELELGDIQ